MMFVNTHVQFSITLLGQHIQLFIACIGAIINWGQQVGRDEKVVKAIAIRAWFNNPMQTSISKFDILLT